VISLAGRSAQLERRTFIGTGTMKMHLTEAGVDDSHLGIAWSVGPTVQLRLGMQLSLVLEPQSSSMDVGLPGEGSANLHI